MLPTQFWSDTTWPESQRTALSKVMTASSSKDETALDHSFERLVALLRDVRDFDLSRLAAGPLRAHR